MNLDNTLYGAGGGILVALAGALGIVRKIERLEDTKVDKSSCDICNKASTERFESIDNKLDMIIGHLMDKHK